METRTPRILLVDDEPRNIRLLEGILFRQPYKLLTAQDGEEALNIVEAEIPDLVLLDVMMPKMDGIEVCQRIKSNPQTRTIPVVMVTALNSVQDRVQALEVGADDFLSKPIDATELLTRVRSLIRVRELYLNLEQVTAEKLRFMAGVAHDIRSPLNALVLNLNMLEGHLPENSRAQQIRNRIMGCVDHIKMLATDVMNYYQMETGQFELRQGNYSLQRIVEAAVTMAVPLAEEHRICLTIETLPDLMLDVDHNVIVQVLLNLLSNAIKYTEANGYVYVRIYDLAEGQYTLPDEHFPPLLALPPKGVVIEVEDTGCGIEPEQFGRVFTEFQRLHSKDTDGVGLGLSVSRRLVQLHGGEVWFTSAFGMGSKFAFFIP